MFRDVITGYYSKFKVIQDHIFGSRSYLSQANLENVYSVTYNIYSKYEKDKHNSYWNITEKGQI